MLAASNYTFTRGSGSSGSVSLNSYASTYTAQSGDTSINFLFESGNGTPTACLSREYAEESFKVDYRLLADGADVTSSLPSGVTVNNTNTYITDYSQNPPANVQAGLKLTGYYIEDGYFYLVFPSGSGGTIGQYTVGSVQNTGEYFEAGNVSPVDGSGRWDLSNANTLKRGMGPNPRPNVGSAQSPIALPSSATLTANPNDSFKIQSFRTPASKTSVSGTGSIGYALSSPQIGVVFGAKFDFVSASNSSSATRACGPLAPGPVTANPSSSSIDVTISQVSAATMYTCYAFLPSNLNSFAGQGSLQETQRATGSKCTIFGLQPGTAYVVNVKATNEEGEGPASPNVSVSTTAGGGGGVQPIVFPTFGSAPSGVTLGSPITGFNQRTTTAGGTNLSSLDWSNGALIGTIVFGSSSTLSLSRLTPSGRDLEFGNQGIFTQEGANNFGWFGQPNSRKLIFLGSIGQDVGFAAADPNADSAPTLTTIESGLDNACNDVVSGHAKSAASILSGPTAKPILEITCLPGGTGSTSAGNRIWVSVDPVNNSVLLLGSVFSSFDGTFYLQSTSTLSVNPDATGSDVAMARVYSSSEAQLDSPSTWVRDLVQIKADGTFVGPHTLVFANAITSPSLTGWPRMSNGEMGLSSQTISQTPSSTVPFRLFKVNLGTRAVTEASGTVTADTSFQGTFSGNQVDQSLFRTVGNGSGSSVYYLRTKSSEPGGAAAAMRFNISGSTAIATTGPVLPTTVGHLALAGSTGPGILLVADASNVYSYTPTSSSTVVLATFANAAIPEGVTPPAGGGTPPAVTPPAGGGTPPAVTPPAVTPPASGGAPALPAQALAKALPKTAKAGKPISIAAATKSKVAVKVAVTGKGCKVSPVKDKKKKIVSYSVTMGKKGVTCTVTVTAPATSKVAALKSVTKIKAS